MTFLCLVVLLLFVLHVDGDYCYGRRWRVGNAEYIPVVHSGIYYVYTRCLETGYAPSVPGEPKCLYGITETPLPLCVKVENGCPILSVPIHGSKKCDKNGRDIDTTCQFQCRKEYYRKGSEIRICQSNQTWSGNTPWCVLRPACPVPPPLVNGKVNGCSRFKKPLYEDSCTFLCNSGFKLFGSDKLTCRLSGRLSDISGREQFPLCVDINECDDDVDHCQHICTNTYGSYKCSCRLGYRQIDRHHCEADLDTHAPSPYHPYGEPRLYQGKRKSTGTHNRRKSCSWNNGGCSQLCVTEEGVAKCQCYDGYEWDAVAENCKRVGLLVPLRPDVQPKTEQKRPGHRDTGLSVGRSCSIGNGGCDQICKEDGASVTCSCRSGYSLKVDGKGCIDIDECAVDNFGCSHLCINTLGGAYCVCKQGYKLKEGGKICEDIDECMDASLNRCDQICANTEGSFNCSCSAGYISHKELKCQACRHNSYRSQSDILCVECPPDSYTKANAQTSIGDCLCSPGFVGDLSKNVPCEDVNECSSGNYGCSHECLNTPGSASCLCPSGFELLEDRKTCQDINECNINNGGCQGFCHNTEGDFHCSCSKGYTVSDTDLYSCSDVDECLDQNGHCSDLCVNFPGSYHCSCPEGYHLDREGRSCIAIRCPKFLVPHHSIVRCFDKSDFTNKTFFKSGELPDSMDFPRGTQCRVFCNKGYETENSVRTIECQTNGKWNSTLPECEVLQCPPLPAPENGDVHPPECQVEPMPVGSKCYFTCHPNHELAGRQMMHCKNNLTWTAKELPRCVPIKVVAFISCPEDVTVILRDFNQSSVTLILPPPVTNMEEFQVEPEWVVIGEPTVFVAGRTDVTYNVNTWENTTIKCEMSVTVSDEIPPVFDYCPDSFDVDGDAFGVQVYYDEPVASDNVGIHSVLKSMEPNSTLPPGVHIVTYVARDSAGNTAKCSFNITVSSSAECMDLADPENGEANCMDWMFGKICEPICNINYTLSSNDANIFMCDDSGVWRPSDIIPPCLPECPFGEVWSSQLQSCEEETLHALSSIPSE